MEPHVTADVQRSGRSLTPDQLARTDCSQCFLLHRRMVSSSGSGGSSDSSIRSLTPEKRANDGTPPLWSHRLRHPETGRLIPVFGAEQPGPFILCSRHQQQEQQPVNCNAVIASSKAAIGSAKATMAPPTPTTTTTNSSSSSKATSWTITAVSVVYLTECLLLACGWFHRLQPDPFIDEPFHWNQTRAYCHGRFGEWNNKITTPPGLYIAAALITAPFQLCHSLLALRLTSLMFACGNLIFFHHILCHRQSSYRHANLVALTLAHLPPLFFLNFLYYTDCASLFFVLAMYHQHVVCANRTLAAFYGFISLWFRQTNIAWIFLLAAFDAIDVLHRSYQQYCQYQKLRFQLGPLHIRFRVHQQRLRNPYYLACFSLDAGFATCRTSIGYLFDGIAFLVFVYLNEGIVLGDRQAHRPALHLAQIAYFLTFVMMFSWPLIAAPSNLIAVFRQMARKPIQLLVMPAEGLATCLSPMFTYQHPYLLADNRHYTFYLWKRFWYRAEQSWFRYAVVPLYHITLLSMWRLVQFPSPHSAQQPVRKAVFFLVTAAVIVPQPLIEFRYFLIPYIVWRLNLVVTAEENPSCLRLELLWSLLINAATLMIFHLKTFPHPDGSLQRIIW